MFLILIFLFSSCQTVKPGENFSRIQEVAKITEIDEIFTATAETANETTYYYIEQEPEITTEPETTETKIETTVFAEKTDKSEEAFIKTLVTPVKILITPEPGSLEPPVNSVKKFPVLMYHTSSENNPGALADLYVKPSEFEKQIKYLSENNYIFCTFDDWHKLQNTEKPVFITFDDGYEENYTEIFPILKKYNAKITIFLVVNTVNIQLTEDMIREMSDSGLVKFESHTLTHVKLAEISSDDRRLTEELLNSKIKIEEITGKRVFAISYPNGYFNKKVKEKAREFYDFGISTVGGIHRTDIDNFEIRRIGVGRYDSLNDFIKFLG